MSRFLNEPTGNGGSEAHRVACRYWPADMRRSMELNAAIRRTEVTSARDRGKANGAMGGDRARGWTCSACQVRNHDRRNCGACGVERP